MIVPYGAYRCADGAVNFAIQNEREWRRLCGEVLGEAALADDPRFATNTLRLENRGALESLIEDRWSRLTRAEVSALLDRAGIANGAVNEVPDVAAHPQLAARGRWTNVNSPSGPIPALIPPHNLANAAPRMGEVPALGQHTREILAELGFEDN
jgi:crotonobetainyl-CoA:carnitine CoA-transferase CaiB-like acyl-CoA transferase